jgi:myo-inositol-1(or 4)-monophosphatase
MSNTRDYLTQAGSVISKTLDGLRPELLNSYGKIDKTHKSDGSVVTQLDHKVEESLKAALFDFDRSIGFSGEEGGVDFSEDTFWLVDPIDGTEHFVRGIPYCSTMVCLITKGEPVYSMIDLFAAGERFTAIKGGGAFCNNQAISVSNRQVNHSLMEFETRGDDEASASKRQAVREEIFGYLNLCAAGRGFSYVAAGRTEARICYEGFGREWDFAPGALLVKEAGGVVANIGRADYDFRDTNLIAANPSVYEYLQQIMQG